MRRSYEKAGERRSSDALAASQRAIVIPASAAEEEKTSDRSYAKISVFFGLMLTSLPVISYCLKKATPAERFVWDLNFKVFNESLNASVSETVECPPNRLWDNDTAVVAACNFFMSVCANMSNVLVNNTFEFQQNETGYLGRCVDAQKAPRFEMALMLFGIVGSLFFLGTAVYLIGRQRTSDALDEAAKTLKEKANEMRLLCGRKPEQDPAQRPLLPERHEAVLIYSGPAPRE